MIRLRKDIPPEYKWDLSAIYPSEEDFAADFASLDGLIEGFRAHEETMLSSAEALYNMLLDYTEIEVLLDKLWTYTSLGHYVDMSDNLAQAKNARVRDLAVKLGEASWFVTPYLQRLSEERLEELYKEYPPLERFRRSLYMIMRYKPHTLSDECEKMYSEMEDCLHLHSGARSIFASSDLRYGKIKNEEGKLVELTDATYIPFMMSTDRRVRRAAFTTLYKTYNQFSNTFGVMYSNHIKEYTTLSRVRRFESSIVRSTFSDELTREVYNNLIDTVSERLPDLYRYYDLKRRVLGLSRMHIYDVYAPLVGEYVKEYSYEDIRRGVVDMASIYGEEYHSVLKAGLYERGWVDVYPSRGKRGGAFSAGCYSTEPYILMNFNGTLDDMTTLAHEAGHSMHSYFSRKYNNPEVADYTLFVAEVASTVNELLLLRKLAREAESERERLYILNQIMELYKSTLFRQTMLAEFERDIHAMCEGGEPLTSDVISATYYEIVKKYFGRGVVCDEQISREWMRIPHFYTCFYVYKYATSISAASAIVRRIEEEGEEYIGQYIEFLKCGGRLSPVDSLLVAGIDMRSPEVIRSAIDSFSETVAEFEKIYFGGKQND